MDIKKLMEEADASVVAEHIGMNVVKKGQYLFIQCPGHEKRLGRSDTHIGNAVLLKNGYKCFACNAFVPTAEMVMEFIGCGKWEAYHIIAEAMGGEELYPDSGENEEIPKIRLSQEELDVLKLAPCSSKTIAWKTVSSKHPPQPVREGLYELYRTDRNAYYRILHERAAEMLEQYNYMKQHFAAPDSDMAYMVYDLLGPAFDRSVYGKLAREFDRRIDICVKIMSLTENR